MDNKKGAPKDAQNKPISDAKVNTPAAKKPLTKIERVLHFLRSNPRGLNLFEAEQIGDHVLRSTISALRREGWLISGEWEYVPTRFGTPTHVLRYRYIGYRNPSEVAEDIASLFGEGAK